DFTVVFSKPVTGFATGDVTLSGTAGATTATVTGSGTTYNVAVSGMTTSGTVIAAIGAGVAQDAAGNVNTPSTSIDNEVTWNKPPTPQKLFGFVEGSVGGRLEGAYVTVITDPGNVELGHDYTDGNGNFTIDMTGVPLGTKVLVQATMTNYKLVAISGIFDEVDEEVNFTVFYEPESDDRRLPFGGGGIPGGPPYLGLWPD
ncbi:MAG: hypothetical protein GX604_06730, partial [Actinobacteria bacterium]|nr:hypothetical protein [Actinomycetota bacterium]